MNTSRRTKKILISSTIAGVLVTGLAACGDDADTVAQTTDPSSESGSSQSVTEDVSPTPEALTTDGAEPTTLLAAAATGLKQVPRGTVVSIDRGAASWEIHVITPDGIEHEMDVAAGGAKVTRGPIVDQDDADDIAEQSALVEAKTIGFQAAAEHALAEVPQGELHELDLESDMGQTVWEAKVIDNQQIERSVTIDATTGEVLSNQYDD